MTTFYETDSIKFCRFTPKEDMQYLNFIKNRSQSYPFEQRYPMTNDYKALYQIMFNIYIPNEVLDNYELTVNYQKRLISD
jgi:hypothetical protein